MGSKAIGLLRHAVVACLGLAILGGILLPVYSDEVGWRLQERAGFDGVDKLYTELCGPNTLARPPFFMMPARWYSALFNGVFADPLYVRLSGVLYALAWLVLLLVLIRRIAADARTGAVLGTIAFGLLSLGTLPLLLVWSRPEQPIVLAFTGALVIAFADWRDPGRETPARQANWRSLAVLCLAVVALSYHIKSIFLAPLFLVCLALASRGRQARLGQAVAAVVLVVATVWAAYYWIHRLECPNDPVFQRDFAHNNSGALLVADGGLLDKLPIVIKLLQNIRLIDYFALPTPRLQPLSFWLAGNQIDDATSFHWFLGLVFSWFGALLCAVASYILAGLRALRSPPVDRRLIASAVLLAAVLAWSATQGVRNVYEAAFVLPMAAISIILALATLERSSAMGKYVAALACAIGGFALFSIPATAVIYGPTLLAARGQPGYIKWQPYSQNAFAYRALEPDILGAARLCGIVDPARQRALLIDDVTYFAFMRSPLPQHKLGLMNRETSVRDPIAYLRSHGSTGVVMGCEGLTPDLRARARRQGQFCCLAPPDWGAALVSRPAGSIPAQSR